MQYRPVHCDKIAVCLQFSALHWTAPYITPALWCDHKTLLDGWKEYMKNGWMESWMDGRNGWVEGNLNGWMDGRNEGWMDTSFMPPSSVLLCSVVTRSAIQCTTEICSTSAIVLLCMELHHISHQHCSVTIENDCFLCAFAVTGIYPVWKNSSHT